MRTRAVHAVALALVSVLLPACGDDDPAGPQNPETVQVTATGFSPSAHGAGSFQLWISFASGLRHSTAASAGRFHIGAAGNIVSESGGAMTFEVDPADDSVPKESDGTVGWQLVVDAFVTWEPASDPAPDSPNLPALVAGSFLNGGASLTCLGEDALLNDFSTAAGSFHLATPTTMSTADENGGVWFATPAPSPAASLTLPTLPTGWKYEGWVSGAFGTVSLGTFIDPARADDDGHGPTVPLQDAPGYALPGSDFPTGAAGVDLRGGTVFLTLEPPASADGAGASFLHILSGSLDAGQATGVSVPLTNVAAFPTVTVNVPFSYPTY